MLSFLVSGPVTAARRTNPAVAAGEPGLIGTWRLVRFESRSKDGKVDYEFGEHPLGYFVYDNTGHLSVQIMRNPPLPPLASGDSDKSSDAEKVQAFGAYVGYFGTYRVDRTKHVLHHQVEGSINPSYTNTDQLRPYRLKGDTLIIEVNDPTDGSIYNRELHRVR
ncbi:MAG: lipocalin-like domain-containing protein [Sphingomonas sp.]|nr:lipocalin-like domain-containing protein [Sphingomonas sp.]